MAYVDPNYKTKKEFKAAVEAGKLHYPYNPGLGIPVPDNGTVYIEGPHYPQPHKWYATCEMRDGIVTKVK